MIFASSRIGFYSQGERVGAITQRRSYVAGGYRQSGVGRERGVESIRAFQELKHLAIRELR